MPQLCQSTRARCSNPTGRFDLLYLSFQRAGALVSDFCGAKQIRVDSVCHPLPEFSYVLQLEALRLKDLLYQWIEITHTAKLGVIYLVACEQADLFRKIRSVDYLRCIILLTCLKYAISLFIWQKFRFWNVWNMLIRSNYISGTQLYL